MTKQPSIFGQGVHWSWPLLALLMIVYGVHLRVQTVAHSEVEHPFRADAGQYYMYARNLSLYGVYSKANTTAANAEIPPQPDAVRSPGFAWLGTLFVSEHDHNKSLKRTLWAQTLVQILSFLLLTWVLIKAVGWHWALPGAFILWTFPHFVSIDAYYLSESLFTSLLALLMCLAWYITQSRFSSLGAIVAAGLLLGLTSLVRPVLEMLPIFIALCAIAYRPKYVKTAALFAAAGMLPVLLWKLRNIAVVGASSDPTLLINGFYHGSFPDFMYQGDPSTFAFPYKYDPRASEVYQGLGTTLSIIWQRCVEQPLTYLYWYTLGKQTYLWQWDIIAGQGAIFIYPMLKSPFYDLPDFYASYQLNYFLHGFWVVAGLITSVYVLVAAFFFKRNVSAFWLLLALLVLYCALIHAVLAGFPRYGIPFKLGLILLSLYGFKEVFQWLKVRWQKRSP